MAAITRLDARSIQEGVSGKVAVVTGGARGIGLATASLLTQHGARVVVVDVLEDELKRACSTLGPLATYRRCDVGDWTEQVELFDWVSQTQGQIDLVICNAAINPEIALLQTPEGDKRRDLASQVNHNYLADERDGSHLRPPTTRLMDINVNSVIYGLKLGIHHMKSRGGRIVITGSAASYVPVASQPLYTASKHAVLGLMRSTAQIEEVVRSGISISMVAPWLTATSMVEGLDALHNPDMMRSSPDDVAAAIAYAAGASTEKTHGKCFWIQGQVISEAEESYGEVIQRLMLQ